MNEIIELLHSGNYSCVIKNGGVISTFTSRGVADLFDLYSESSLFSEDAMIADKVVGKAAASLMVLLGFSKVYADVISSPALSVLRNADIDVRFSLEVPVIINRSLTGPCPLEALTKDAASPEEALPIISKFINSLKK